MRPEPGVERIAVLRANALGDLIFALPAFDALRAAYPQAEIVLLAQEWHREFLRGRPGPLDRVEVAGEDPAPFAGEGWDLALQMHGGGKWSNLYIAGLGARITAGTRADDAAPLDRTIPYVYYQPEVGRWLEVAGLVGAAPVTLEPRIAVTEADRAEASDALEDPGSRWAVLHPGATDGRRRWPPARFAAVGDELARDGLRVAVVGVESEREVVDAVRAGMEEPSVDLCGRIGLGGLTGVLAAAEVVVADDSGPLHLAGAVGTATVGVYWVGNVVTAGPLTRARHVPLASFRTDCPVCGADCTREPCPHDASFVDRVETGEVLAAARALLAGRPAPAPV